MPLVHYKSQFRRVMPRIQALQPHQADHPSTARRSSISAFPWASSRINRGRRTIRLVVITGWLFTPLLYPAATMPVYPVPDFNLQRRERSGHRSLLAFNADALSNLKSQISNPKCVGPVVRSPWSRSLFSPLPPQCRPDHRVFEPILLARELPHSRPSRFIPTFLSTRAEAVLLTRCRA